jgi:hypothetical protein
VTSFCRNTESTGLLFPISLASEPIRYSMTLIAVVRLSQPRKVTLRDYFRAQVLPDYGRYETGETEMCLPRPIPPQAAAT